MRSSLKSIRKRKVRQFVYSWPLVILLLVVAFFFVRAAWNMYERYVMTRGYYEQAERELAAASERREKLEAAVARMQDARGEEALLRQKYDLAREGEELIVIVDSNTAEREGTAEGDSGSLWSWFRGIFSQ